MNGLMLVTPVTYSNAEQLLELNIFSAMLYVAGTKYRNFMQGLGGGPAHEPIHIPQTFSHQASPLDQETRGVREKSSHLSEWKHKVSMLIQHIIYPRVSKSKILQYSMKEFQINSIKCFFLQVMTLL